MSIQEKKSAKGTAYAIVKFSDKKSEFELFLFSEILVSNREILKESETFALTLQKDISSDDNIKKRVNVRKIINLDEIIYGSIGIHPHESSIDKMDKEFIVENANKFKKIIGVGETGLDFYYENSHKDDQIKSFKKHINVSRNTQLPIIIHTREADDETCLILEPGGKT